MFLDDERNTKQKERHMQLSGPWVELAAVVAALSEKVSHREVSVKAKAVTAPHC